MQEILSLVQSLATNGKSIPTIVLIAALAGITVLGALHDVSSYAIVAIYSAVIGASAGHISGERQGRLEAENGQLKSAGSDAKTERDN